MGQTKHGIGERMLPATPESSPVERLLFSRHRFAYEQAAERVSGMDILEVGCGTAYGTKILAGRARTVQALDVDDGLIRELAGNTTPNVTYSAYDGVRLPFPDGAFDAVVSFQVLEHVRDDTHFLREIGRVLEPSGTGILTTPNRLLRLAPGQAPFNNFHVREYSPGDLEEVIAAAGLEAELRGVFGDPATQAMEVRRLRKYRTWPYRHVFQRLPRPLQVAFKELLLRIPGRGRKAGSPAGFRWRLTGAGSDNLDGAVDLWAEIRHPGEAQ